MSGIKFSVTLEVEPQANFHEYEKAVMEEYESECKKYANHGLFHLVATENQWASAIGNTKISAEGVNKDVARPVFNLPNDPAANAGSAAVALYTRYVDRYQNVVEATEKLKKRFLVSLGVDNVSHISDPIHGTRNITAMEIMEAMRILHATPSADVILAYKQKLEVTIVAEQTFSGIVCMYRNTHNQLMRAEQPLSMFDKVSLLVRSVSTLSDIVEAMKSYKVRVPLVKDPTFEDLVAHVIQQAPNMTAAAAGYAGAAVRREELVTTAMLNSAVKDAYAKGLSQGRAESTNNNSSSNRVKGYCFVHGYGAHTGEDCYNMKDSSKFNQLQRSAKDHTAAPGGNSKGKR